MQFVDIFSLQFFWNLVCGIVADSDPVESKRDPDEKDKIWIRPCADIHFFLQKVAIISQIYQLSFSKWTKCVTFVHFIRWQTDPDVLKTFILSNPNPQHWSFIGSKHSPTSSTVLGVLATGAFTLPNLTGLPPSSSSWSRTPPTASSSTRTRPLHIPHTQQPTISQACTTGSSNSLFLQFSDSSGWCNLFSFHCVIILARASSPSSAFYIRLYIPCQPLHPVPASTLWLSIYIRPQPLHSASDSKSILSFYTRL